MQARLKRIAARKQKVKDDLASAASTRAWHISLSAAAVAQLESATTRGVGLAAIGLSSAVKTAEWVNTNPVLLLPSVPVKGTFQMTSIYGLRRHPVLRKRKMHAGIDLAAKPGTPVVAAGGGVVLEANNSTGYGRLIVIDHGDGVTTRYGHLRRYRVKAGQKVVAGQLIGNVGQSGRATGPHLHFEVRIHGEPVDPSQNVGFSLIPPTPEPDNRVAGNQIR